MTSARRPRRSCCRRVGAVTSLLVASLCSWALPTHGSTVLPAEVRVRETGAFPGYTLIVPQTSTETHLIDLNGTTVHTWQSRYQAGLSASVRKDGMLLRTGRVEPSPSDFASAPGGAGGVVELLDWDSRVVARFEYASDQHLQHHDAASLPNGNVLMLAWDYKTSDEAIAMGRDPATLRDGRLYPDSVIEVDLTTGAIVWEWHVWDHLVQHFDPTKPNYGTVSDYPGRIDVNWVTNGGQASWNHLNSIDYDARRDEIIVSSREFSEVWVIDHATTTKQARGKRGDLLARYGNPAAHGSGTTTDRALFYQHNARVIPKGTPGAGNYLVFSNGDVETRPRSTVEEITPIRRAGQPRLDARGTLEARVNRVYPGQRAANEPLFASFISGAQRLPNGNLLITDGPVGRVFEMTALGTKVWEYWNDHFQPGPVVTAGVFEIRPERLFRAERYAPSYPGLRGRHLADPAPTTNYRY